MNKFKRFAWGFVKGFAILLIVVLLYSLLHSLFALGDDEYNLTIIGLIIISALFVNGYFVQKYKQSKVWMILTLFMSFNLTPFLLGAIEVSKTEKKKGQKK